MPELKVSGLLLQKEQKDMCTPCPRHFRWYTSTALGLILAYWLKTAFPLAFSQTELPRRSLVTDNREKDNGKESPVWGFAPLTSTAPGEWLRSM